MITRYDDYGHEYQTTWWQENRFVVFVVTIMLIFAAMVITTFALETKEAPAELTTCTCCTCAQDSIN